MATSINIFQATSSYYKEFNTYKDVLSYVTSFIPDGRWYIAGGFAKACLHSTNDFQLFTDIDIYFETEAEFQRIYEALARNPKCNQGFTSDNAITFEVEKCQIMVQLIRREFGQPEDVVKNFDLSCSRVYLDHNNQAVKGSTYDEDLDAAHISSMTVTRMLKYHYRYHYPIKYTMTKILDRIINDPKEMIFDYYDKKETEIISILKFSWKVPHELYDICISYLDSKDADYVLHEFLRCNFIPNDIFSMQQKRYSLKTEALVYHKIQRTPPEDVLEAYPEIFI